MENKKIAVVTGASSGMGRQFAVQLADHGQVDEIWVIARRRDRLEELAQALSKPVRVLPMDLQDKAAFQQYAAELDQHRPQVTFLVSAAGFGVFGDYREVGVEDTMRMIDLNVKAMAAMVMLSLPYLVRGGHVITLSSESSFNPLPYFNVYASTKAFMKHYTAALKTELRPRGITATAVCPGWVETEFFRYAKNNIGNSPKQCKPISRAEDVVAKALRDAEKGRTLSVYGWFPKLHYALAKLLPQRWMTAMWLGLQKHPGERDGHPQ